MNGGRAREGGTAESRIAAFVRAWIYAKWPVGARTYPPDYADIEEVIKYRVRRELLLERIEEAKECKNPERVNLHVRALLDLDAANGHDTPYSDVT